MAASSIRSNPLLENPDEPRRRFMLVLGYDGAPFNGWQIQPNDPSVQESLEKALNTALRSPLHIVGAGRTDTGVNAREMVAHFDLPEEIGKTLATDKAMQNKVLHTLNAILRPAIAVFYIVPVPNEAHSRFDAVSRTYRYYLHTVPDPFRSQSSRYFYLPVDFELMNTEALDLIGTKDFTSFSKLHTDTNNNICTVTAAKWHQYGDGHYFFEITANRFLRNMVRAIVGTLLDVGTGRNHPGHVKKVIEAMNRCAAGTSVPGHALYLWKIDYPYPLPSVPLPNSL